MVRGSVDQPWAASSRDRRRPGLDGLVQQADGAPVLALAAP